MRFFKNIIILSISLLFGCDLLASHMLGAEMSYKSIGNNKYVIRVTVFRDCSQIAMNKPTFGCFAGLKGGNGCGSANLTLTTVSVRDVSNRCSTTNAPCNPVNTGFTGVGMEEHVYEAIVDFAKTPLSTFVNNSSCCEVTFYVGQCCRSNAITTGMAGNDFFTTCMINLCNLKECAKTTNSMVEMTNVPLYNLCCNVPVRYNMGAIDTVDVDSLSYKLVDGIATLPNNPVDYGIPFSSRYFITPYCIPPTSIKCTPNPNATTPAGNYFDTSTGDVVFTPTKCNEASILVIEVTERRKSLSGQWVVVGKTRRDMGLFLKDDCSWNKAPLIKSSKGKYIVLNQGDSLDMDFDVTDAMYAPYQTVPDTVLARWNGGLLGATFAVIDAKSREKKYKLKWKTNKINTLPGIYQFTVTATDQHCNPPSHTTMSVKVKVNGPATSGLNDVLMPSSGVFVYPNPTDGKLTLKLSNGEFYYGEFEIFDMVGRSLLNGRLGNDLPIDVAGLLHGCYLIKIHDLAIFFNKE